MAWIRAGNALLDKEQIEQGEVLFLKGEKLKTKEAEYLYEQIKKEASGKRIPQVNSYYYKYYYWLRELEGLDPKHPWIWYTRGNVLKALQEAAKRGWSLGRLDEIPRLRSVLSSLNPVDELEKFMARFYLSLLDLEQKKMAEAVRQLDELLKEKPNFFPGLLVAERLLNDNALPEEKRGRWANVKAKLNLFNMEEVPIGAWNSIGQPNPQGATNFQAIYRNSRPAIRIALHMPREAYGWKIFLDDIFVAARINATRPLNLNLPITLEPGEHQLSIKVINNPSKEKDR